MCRRASKWGLAILISLIMGFAFGKTVEAIPGFGMVEIDRLAETQILSATIQIRMFTPVGGAGEYVMAQGLGTLIQNGLEIQIVTHNHWGDVLGTAEFVRFHDAFGHLLLEINGAKFRQGIRTQDAGTLLMKAPSELSVAGEALTFAHLGSSYDVKEGDKVLLVHQELGGTGKLVLMEGIVDGSRLYKQLAVFRVQTLDGKSIISGDSGGGVWFAGALVGNMWGRETVQQPEGLKVTNWLKPTRSLMEVGYVAKLPQGLVGRSSD